MVCSKARAELEALARAYLEAMSDAALEGATNLLKDAARDFPRENSPPKATLYEMPRKGEKK